MNRRVIIILVIVVIGLIVGALFLAPLFFGAGFNAAMQVTWLDENGNPVAGGPSYAFIGPQGAPVASVRVDGSWTLISSSGAPVKSPQVSGTLTITVRLNTYRASLVNTVTRSLVWSAQTSGEFTDDFDLATLIGTPTQIGKDYGWSISFVLDLEASGVLDGEITTASDTASASYKVTWSQDTLLLNGIITLG